MLVVHGNGRCITSITTWSLCSLSSDCQVYVIARDCQVYAIALNVYHIMCDYCESVMIANMLNYCGDEVYLQNQCEIAKMLQTSTCNVMIEVLDVSSSM